MESVLGRYRNLIVLVGVLFLQVLGLAVQVKRGAETENTRLIRVWAVSTVTPFERGLVWVQNSSSNLWHNYFYLRGVRAENRELKEQIEQMRLEQVRLSEDAAQAHRLQALLSFKEQFVSKTVGAQVIGTSGSDLSRIVYIDKGSDSAIKPDMAVITADGIVGKVWEVFPSVSKVLLINDQSSGVGAMLEKTRLQGVLKGTANGEVVLERLTSDEEVQPGESVLTSGGDQIFPKGLPIGTVAHVGTGKDLFLNIKIRPAANLSKLEEVLVVTERQERQATAQDTTRMRAADILAQRLPSVPDKPADPTAKGTAAGVAANPLAAKPQPKPLAPGLPASGTNSAANPAAKPAPQNPAASNLGPTAKSPVPGSANARPAASNPVAGQPVSKPISKPVTSPAGSQPGAPGAGPAGSIVEVPASTKPPVSDIKPLGTPPPPASQPTPQPAPGQNDDGPH